MVKVKIIEDSNRFGLTNEINKFTSNNKIDVIDIKFEVEYISTYKTTYYAMIIYRDRQIYG